MDEHAVVTATWTERPIYCRIVPWSERILGMTRADAVAERERYSRGEVWCRCVSEIFPEGFEASLDVKSMRAITAEEFEAARSACLRAAADPDNRRELAVTGRGRKLSWRRKRAAATS